MVLNPRYHLIPVKIAVIKNDNGNSGDEDAQRIEPLSAGDKNVNYGGLMERPQKAQYIYHVIQQSHPPA